MRVSGRLTILSPLIAAETTRMTARITVVVGLPGSGKTWFMQSQRAGGARDFDDFHGSSRDDCPQLLYSRHLTALDDAVEAGHHCYIGDIAFCSRERREQTVADLQKRYPGVPLDFRFYANDPEQCRRNLSDAPASNADRLRRVDEFTHGYEIPVGKEAVPVAVRI